MDSTSSITVQSLGKIVQLAPAVKDGVCMFFSVTLQGLRAVRSTMTYFEQM